MFRSQTGRLVRKLFIVLTLVLGFYAMPPNLGESNVDAAILCCSICDPIHYDCLAACDESFFLCNDRRPGNSLCSEQWVQCQLNCDSQFADCTLTCDESC